MSPVMLGILVSVCVVALLFAFWPTSRVEKRAEKRRKNYKMERSERKSADSLQKNRDSRRKTVEDALKAQSLELTSRQRKKNLKSRIFQAGLNTPVSAWIRNCIILGVAAAIVLWILQVPILYAVVFGISAGYLLPKIYLGWKTKKYQSAYLDELPNAVEAIVRGVRAGMPLNDSIRLVSREAKEPVKSEFGRVLEQQLVGKSMAEAVGILFDRVPLPEVNFFIVVIVVQQQSGGNLSEALSNLAHVLRNRKKMKAKVSAMSSEAKASAIIIGALPLFVAAAVSVVSPSYLLPLVTTNGGLICLGVAAIMVSLGTFVMNRMVQFDY